MQNLEAPTDEAKSVITQTPDTPDSSDGSANPDDGLETAEKESKLSDSRTLQFFALGMSLLMIVLGCAGLVKIGMMTRRRIPAVVPVENSVISLYLEEDEIKALEAR